MTRGLNLPLSEQEIRSGLLYFYRKEVERRKNIFRKTDDLMACINAVGDFMTIEERKYGLFLPGGVGNGKTTMLKAIRSLLNFLIDNEKIEYCEGSKYPRLVTSTEIVETLLDSRRDFRELKTAQYLLIDELGSEQTEVKSFGMVYHPFYEILSYRYDNLLPTFITSNLNPTDVGVKYEDDRINDRMYEMFKVVSFKEGSFR